MRHLETLMMLLRSNVVTVSIVMITFLSVFSDGAANLVVNCLTMTLIHFMTLSLVMMILHCVCLNSASWPIFLVLVSMTMFVAMAKHSKHHTQQNYKNKGSHVVSDA